MKPDLVIGLGNPLMGDDGAGAAAAEVLANDRRLARRVDVISADTDVLSCANQMERRRRVLLIDAVEGDIPGSISVLRESPPLAGQQQHAHHLSAPAMLALLRQVTPTLRDTEFTWILVTVNSASVGMQLSPEVAAAIPKVVERVRQELRRR
ncbi:MAG: hydrogenase maturation protease [Bryobacteraceae bacterium]|jgi:hydrogenase maturation protease